MFYSLTPRKFFLILKGYNKKREDDIKTSWEQARRIAWSVWMVYHKTGNLKPQDVFVFPWDESREALSEAEQKARDEEYLASIARWEERDRIRKEKADC